MKRLILVTGAIVYLFLMLICYVVNAQNQTTNMPLVHIHTIKDFKGKITVKDTSFRMDSTKMRAFMMHRGPHRFGNDSQTHKHFRASGDTAMMAHRKMMMARMHNNNANAWAAHRHGHRMNADSISIVRRFTVHGDSIVRETRRITYFKPSPNNKNIKTTDTLIKIDVTVHKGIKPGDLPDANDQGLLNQDLNGGNAPDGNTLELTNFSLFPNPSNGQTRISFSSTDLSPVGLKISDMQGKTAWQDADGSFSGRYDKTIDLSNQPKGVYLLEIFQNNKTMLKKLVIN